MEFVEFAAARPVRTECGNRNRNDPRSGLEEVTKNDLRNFGQSESARQTRQKRVADRRRIGGHSRNPGAGLSHLAAGERSSGATARSEVPLMCMGLCVR